MIVVWVEASAEVVTASSTIQSQPPMTSVASTAKMASSSSAFSARKLVPALADHREAHADVGHQQDDRRPDAGLARRGGGVLDLLGEVDRGLPAPVDEDAEQQPAGERGAAGAERVEPGTARSRATGRGCLRDLEERDHREARSKKTCARIRTFWTCADELGAEHAEPVIGRISATAASDGRPVVGQAVQSDRQQPEPHGHIGQRADDQHAGHGDRPAADPAEPRTHRPGDPGERRPAVLVDPVQVVERRGDQQHRDEGGQHHPGA